jgi:hypothetical protein
MVMPWTALASAGIAMPGSTSQLRSLALPSPRNAVTIRSASTSTPVVSVSNATSGPTAQPWSVSKARVRKVLPVISTRTQALGV